MWVLVSQQDGGKIIILTFNALSELFNYSTSGSIYPFSFTVPELSFLHLVFYSSGLYVLCPGETYNVGRDSEVDILAPEDQVGVGD